MQHCSNARQILSQIAGSVQKANAAKNKAQAAKFLSDEYIKKCIGLNQTTLDGANAAKYKEYIQESLMTCVLQLAAVNEVGQDAKQ